MGMLTGVLIVLVLLWGRASLVVTALFFNNIVPADFDVIEAEFNGGNWEFLAAYATVGSVFASLAFAGLAVTGPLLGHATWHAYRQSVRWL